jgi:uncharacterized protein
MTTSSYTPTDRTTVRRLPERASYDADVVHAILDEALVCHVGVVVDGRPRVIPTVHARVDQRLYLHGSVASQLLRALREGVEACVTITLVDGLVLARSAFHHAVNYRSVVIFGTARLVTDEAEKRTALQALTEHVAPGRWDEVRPPSAVELAQTMVLTVPLAEVSAKVRTGPPREEEADLSLPVWAGELPLRLAVGSPVPDPGLLPGVTPGPAVSGWRGPGS